VLFDFLSSKLLGVWCIVAIGTAVVARYVSSLLHCNSSEVAAAVDRGNIKSRQSKPSGWLIAEGT
jgi:hypothetical protein